MSTAPTHRAQRTQLQQSDEQGRAAADEAAGFEGAVGGGYGCVAAGGGSCTAPQCMSRSCSGCIYSS
jgi:hypothetical protein